MNTCRLCHAPVRPFLDLGNTPLPEEFRTRHRPDAPINTYTLGLSVCRTCAHVQLSEIVHPKTIYRRHYFYDYSITQAGQLHWSKLCQTIYHDYHLSKHDLVVDIGSNTGALLEYFRKKRPRILGIDPATKLARIAQKNGIPTINEFFSPAVARAIVRRHGQATIATCTNVFDHVEDLKEFMMGIVILLKKDGALIIEVPYFYTFLQKLTHIVYHQQIDYMMLTPLLSFFSPYGFVIVDAQVIDIHGGSIRLTVQKNGTQTTRLKKLLLREQRMFRDYPTILRQFSKRVYHQRDNIKKTIQTLKKQGKTITAVGASAKGITLLNYCGIGRESIDAISEKSPLKIGRYTPSGIPIVSDEWLVDKQPEYVILLSWNFAHEIIGNIKKYNGRWIIPIPAPHILP